MVNRKFNNGDRVRLIKIGPSSNHLGTIRGISRQGIVDMYIVEFDDTSAVPFKRHCPVFVTIPEGCLRLLSPLEQLAETEE